MLSSAGLRVLSTSTDVHVYAHQTITTVTGMNMSHCHQLICQGRARGKMMAAWINTTTSTLQQVHR